MFIDCGTKMMDSAHVRQMVQRGQWSIEYQPEFIKQTYKKKKDTDLVNDSSELPGRDVGAEDFELMNHVNFYALSAGWHYKEKENIGVRVATHAKSFRSPAPRFQLREFALRTTLAEFRTKSLPKWRILEERADLLDVPNPQEILPVRALRLVTFFEARPGAKPTRKQDG